MDAKSGGVFTFCKFVIAKSDSSNVNMCPSGMIFSKKF